MAVRKCVSKSAFSISFALTVSGAVLALVSGCPVVSPGGGNLAGTVTNSLTGSGVSGVMVTLEPAVEGVDITTASGGWSAPPAEAAS